MRFLVSEVPLYFALQKASTLWKVDSGCALASLWNSKVDGFWQVDSGGLRCAASRVPPRDDPRDTPVLYFFFFFITLGLELSDTKVYEP